MRYSELRIILLSLLIACSGTGTIGIEQVKAADTVVPATAIIDRLAPNLTKYTASEIIETIRFSRGSAAISSADQDRLKKLAAICSSDSLHYVKVFGFTDTAGTESENERLAEKRVLAVLEKLEAKGPLPSDKWYAAWLGESADVYDLHFPKAHVRQDCVDIWILIRRRVQK